MRSIRIMPKFAILVIVLVAVVVFLAYATVSSLSARTMREQEANALYAYHVRLSKYVNDHINNMANSALIFMYREISPGELHVVQSNIDKKTALVKNLQMMTDINPGIHSLCFFSGNERKVLHYAANALTILTFDEFYDTSFYMETYLRDTYSYLSGTRAIPYSLRDAPRQYEGGRLASVTSVTKKLPLRGGSRDMLIVNIEEAFFQNLLISSNLPERSIILITDTAGGSMLSYQSDDEYTKLTDGDLRAVYQEAYKGGALRERFSINVAGERFFVSTSLEHKNRVYYTLVPEEALSQSYSRANMIMLQIELIILAVGALLAMFLTGTITRPIGDMLGQLEGRERTSERRAIVSYPMLGRMSEQIGDILKRTQEQEIMLSKYFSSYRSSILLSLLTGEQRPDDMPEGEVGIPTGYAAYLAIVGRFYVNGEAETNREAHEQHAQLAAARLSALGAAQWVCVSNAEIALLISLKDGSDYVLNDVQTQLNELLECVAPPVVLAYSMGEAFSSPADISVSYRLAREAYGDKAFARHTVLTERGAPEPEPERDKIKYHDSRSAELIERVKLYIADHYGGDVSLNAIADYLYLTPQYLGKLFKEITGETFTSHVTRVRMEVAGGLLRGTRKSVGDISEAIGYFNAQSFGRAFKGYYGMTPGDYRRQQGAIGKRDSA